MQQAPAPPAFGPLNTALPYNGAQQGTQVFSQSTTSYVTGNPGYPAQVQPPQPAYQYSVPQQHSIQYQQQAYPVQYHQPQLPTPPPYASAPVSQPLADYHDTVTSTPTTQRYQGSNAGGEAQRQAEASGQAGLQRYETQVQQLLDMAQDTCPARYPWLNMDLGWICGGGTHFTRHEQMDEILLGRTRRRVPEPEYVNSMRSEGVMHPAAHPPDVAHGLPMHRVHQRYITGLACEWQRVLSTKAARRAGGGRTSHPCVYVEELGMTVLDDADTGDLSFFPTYSSQGIFFVGEIVSRGARSNDVRARDRERGW